MSNTSSSDFRTSMPKHILLHLTLINFNFMKITITNKSTRERLTIVCEEEPRRKPIYVRGHFRVVNGRKVYVKTHYRRR